MSPLSPEHQDFTPTWEYVADRVMGGVSNGGMAQETYKGRAATVLRGDVSLDNNGGFVQIAFDLQDERAWLNAGRWDGIEIDVCGNAELYDLRLRTTQLSRPWQSFRTEFAAPSDWTTLQLPFGAFEPHRTDAAFAPEELRRIGILGIGRVFRTEIAVARVGLYRGAPMTTDLSDEHRSGVIEMALSDHVRFEDIEREYGLSEKEVKALMRSSLKPGSYRAWRKRVRAFSDRRETYK